jgi:hypothetical protein
MGRKGKGDGREDVPRPRDQSLRTYLLGLPAGAGAGIEMGSRQAYRKTQPSASTFFWLSSVSPMRRPLPKYHPETVKDTTKRREEKEKRHTSSASSAFSITPMFCNVRTA